MTKQLAAAAKADVKLNACKIKTVCSKLLLLFHICPTLNTLLIWLWMVWHKLNNIFLSLCLLMFGYFTMCYYYWFLFQGLFSYQFHGYIVCFFNSTAFLFAEDKDSDGKDKKSKSKDKEKKKEPASMFMINGEKSSKSKKKGNEILNIL